jgi:hypothetical protein
LHTLLHSEPGYSNIYPSVHSILVKKESGTADASARVNGRDDKGGRRWPNDDHSRRRQPSNDESGRQQAGGYRSGDDEIMAKPVLNVRSVTATPCVGLPGLHDTPDLCGHWWAEKPLFAGSGRRTTKFILQRQTGWQADNVEREKDLVVARLATTREVVADVSNDNTGRC